MNAIQLEVGFLIYLRQEGRGIGLYNKLNAYALQSKAYDTYESSRMLGFGNDLRSYKVASQRLQVLVFYAFDCFLITPTKPIN